MVSTHSSIRALSSRAIRLLGDDRSNGIEGKARKGGKIGAVATKGPGGDLHDRGVQVGHKGPREGIRGPRWQSRYHPGGACRDMRSVRGRGLLAASHPYVPRDALSFGVKDGHMGMVRVEGERALTFGDVLVRVSPDFRLSMHIDTDEANAASIETGVAGYPDGTQ